MKNAKLVVFWLAILSLWNLGTALAQDNLETLTYNGEQRSFYVHVPASFDEAESLPLLIALHPTSSSGLAMAFMTGFDAIADERGFVAAYPNSSGYAWGEDPTQVDAPDDVGFIGSLIDHLIENYNVDAERVYLTGFGNGGLMAYRLACEVPERFDALAVVGSHPWGYHRDNCPNTVSAPVDLLIINGTENHFYRPDNYHFTSVWDSEAPLVLGKDDTLAFWADRNGCDTEEVSEDANMRVYNSCDGDVAVAYYSVLGGGYTWPRIGDYQLNQYGVDASEIIARFFFEEANWAIPQSEPYEDTPRSYVYYVPTSYEPSAPTPLVVLLHGRFSSGAGNAAFADMNQVAETNGFIALYPDGLQYPNPVSDDDMGWNYVGVTGASPGIYSNDVVFLSALIADLSVDLNIDHHRVYVLGFSNGGFMIHKLACAVPDQYTAFATIAGSALPDTLATCQSDTPVPMLIVHGTADDNVRWNGSATYGVGGVMIYTTLPILQVANFWAQHNQCSGEAEISDIPSSGLSPDIQVRVLTANDCAGDSEVVIYAIIGGGHNWPGVESEHVSNVTLDIHGSDVVWEFFSRHVSGDEEGGAEDTG